MVMKNIINAYECGGFVSIVVSRIISKMGRVLKRAL